MAIMQYQGRLTPEHARIHLLRLLRFRPGPKTRFPDRDRVPIRILDLLRRNLLRKRAELLETFRSPAFVPTRIGTGPKRNQVAPRVRAAAPRFGVLFLLRGLRSILGRIWCFVHLEGPLEVFFALV